MTVPGAPRHPLLVKEGESLNPNTMYNNLIKTVDDYLLNQTPELVERLYTLRNLILEVCPEAQESISYGMPAYKYKKKPLCYFGVFKNHIGFFPTAAPVAKFEKELAGFKCSKGTVQLPMTGDLPLELLKKLVAFRMSLI